MVLAWVRVIAVEVREGEIIDTFGKWSQEDLLTDQTLGGCGRKKNVKGKSRVFKVRNCKHEITTYRDMAILREELLKCCLKYHDYLVSAAAPLGTLHWPHLEKRSIVDAQYC